jgi:microcystin-dependent protein
MAEPFIGEIRIFSFGYNPEGWFPCDGRILTVAEYQSLFSLLTNVYGGDGRTTFALPNYQGRVPITFGHGAGLSNFRIGQVGGVEAQSLSVATMPIHNHGLLATETEADTVDPGDGLLANARSSTYAKPNTQDPPPLNTQLLEGCISSTGKGEQVNNMQPYLCLNFCIAFQGAYPVRS